MMTSGVMSHDLRGDGTSDCPVVLVLVSRAVSTVIVRQGGSSSRKQTMASSCPEQACSS